MTAMVTPESKVDKFVPQTQHVNLRIVRQGLRDDNLEEGHDGDGDARIKCVEPPDQVRQAPQLPLFRGGLVVKAHRLFYHSTLGLRVIKKKKKKGRGTPRPSGVRESRRSGCGGMNRGATCRGWRGA